MAERRRVERLLPALYVKPRRPAPPAAGTALWTSGRCRTCGDWFVSQYLDVTCSPQCQKAKVRKVRAVVRDRRRARKRDAYVADVVRLDVFKADGYRCHLCKRLCDPWRKVPDPRAPTIDHIVPLAQGGTHEPLNCRTACYACNCRKGDRGGGEQLLLLTI
jgi:5-methylcytosine-specific restriction endonuclease McrA